MPFRGLRTWYRVEESAHLPHPQEPARFREVVQAFRSRVEAVSG